MFQDIIQESQSPIYDEYADSDWYKVEAALNSLCQALQAAQARADPPPRSPDSTNGHTRGSHEHYSYEGEVTIEHIAVTLQEEEDTR